ncbi:VIR protein [Plasmodium vivax]|uniref:VIR protein n=1 Tax=Plasmodium vivax TaxID=5855 RepID=A0A1G4E2Y3_PLAVI|nr:VIR protein [Plasmodium vivax]
MSVIKPNNEFFNYGDYKRVKDSFYSAYGITYDKGILDKIINNMTTYSLNKKILNPVFIRLMKYLSRDYAFGWVCAEEECCKYINNWLNIELTTPYYGLNENIFTIFDEFMKYFHIHKDGKRCKNRIYLMEEEKVRNVKILYNLYDKYTYLEEKNKTEHNKLPCSTYHSLITDYNRLINNYRKQNKDYLNNLLNAFKTKIEQFESISKGGCKKNVELLPPVEPPSLPPEAESANHVVHLSQPEGTTILQGQESRGEESQVSQQQLDLKAVKLDHEIAPGHLTQDRLQNIPSDQILTELTRERIHSRHFGNSVGTEVGSNFGNPLGPNHSYQLMGQLYVDKPSQLPEDRTHDLSAERGNKDGYYSTITDTISGFIKDVEPGPVLGVSGGMGVLFLLFKLDPSLEEEEDDSVKFLEVLET